jgi:hypothetical protein
MCAKGKRRLVDEVVGGGEWRQVHHAVGKLPFVVKLVRMCPAFPW